MKKILLSVVTFATITLLNGQTLLSENFNAFTNGSVTSDITGTTAGQNGWYTYSTVGSATDYTITTIDATHTKSPQITSSNTASGSKYLFIGINWAGRNAGNDVLNFSGEIYTGSASGGTGGGRYIFYDASGNITVGISYNYSTQKIQGLAYYNNAGTLGNYAFNLGTATYPANTWIPVSLSFNKTTGQVMWKYPEGTYYTTGADAGVDPEEIDLVASVTTSNTVAHLPAFDNVLISADATSKLSVNNVTRINSTIDVYPNPATDFVNIDSKDNIKSIRIFELSGKTIDAKLKGKTVDIKNLPKGIYILNIETENGIISKKIIKK